MSIDFSTHKVEGFDKTLLLNHVGYIGKPVTVNQATIAGLTANDAGNYIIPQGTLLTGEVNSLLVNPQQMAVETSSVEDLASVTVNSIFTVTAKESGAVSYAVSMVKGVSGTPVSSIAYTPATTKFVITLATDKYDAITATYGDVVALFNNDLIANSLVIAELINASDEVTLATVTATSTDAIAQSTSLGSTGTVAKTGTYTGTDNEVIHCKVTTAPTATGNVAGMIVSTAINSGSYVAQPVFTTGTSATVVVSGITFTFTLATGQTFAVGEIYSVNTYIGPTTSGGGSETITGIIDGILLHSVDVTDGENFGALVVAGSINMDNMPVVPSTAVKGALPRILFSRID